MKIVQDPSELKEKKSVIAAKEKKIIKATSIALVLAVSSAAVALPQEPSAQTSSMKSGRRLPQADRKDSVMEAWREADEAERKGNYRWAEIKYQEMCDLAPQVMGFHENLARIYEKTGRDNLALQEYRKTFGEDRSFSLIKSDSRILVRYGDLAEKLGSRKEAMGAYKAAIGGDVGMAGPSLIRPSAWNDAFATVKSAAYVASAMKHWSVGDDKKFDELTDLAVRIDAGNWQARFYHARSLGDRSRVKEARKEYAVAAQMAPATSSVEIIKEAKNLPKAAKPKGVTKG